MNDEKKEGKILTSSNDEVDTNDIVTILSGLITPITKAQEFSEKEATNRATIFANIVNKLIFALILIALAILLLSAYALNLGYVEASEKIAFGLLGFLGGLGTGRLINK